MLTNWKFSETWLKQEQIEVTQKSFFGSCSQGRLQGKIAIAMVRPFWKALIVYFLPLRIFSFFASNHLHILVRHWWLHYNKFFHLVFLEIFSIKREIMKMISEHFVYKLSESNGQATREFLRLRMRNFQGIVFIWTQTYNEIFKSESKFEFFWNINPLGGSSKHI